MNSPSTRVFINAKPCTLACPATLADAVAWLGIQPPFAAAVNLQFVPKHLYAQTVLKNADAIDLIAPVTGG